MALRERLIKDNGFSTVVGDDSVSNQQSFQDMKARLHRLLINRMDLTKMRMLEPEQLHDEVARLEGHEMTRIPEALDYAKVRGLSFEVRQKLSAQRPETVGQASRISGVTPAAVSLLLVHLKRWGKANREGRLAA